MSENPGEFNHVSSESEIPAGPHILRFNQGHVPDLLAAGIIDKDSLYLVGDSKNPYSSTSIDRLLQNKTLQENPVVELPSLFSGGKPRQMRVQSVLYELIFQELDQKDTVSQLKQLLDGIEAGDRISSNQQYVKSRLKNNEQNTKIEYWQAQATDELLVKLEGPESSAKIKSRRNTEKKLKRDENRNIMDVSSKLEDLRGIVSAIRAKIGPEI